MLYYGIPMMNGMVFGGCQSKHVLPLADRDKTDDEITRAV